MRVDARQARCPPRGRLMHGFPPPSPQIPPPSPRPVPASLRVPWAADGIAPRRDRTTPARLPSTDMDAARSGSAGDGAGEVWGVGSPGCRLPSVDGRGRVRPCPTGSPPGVRGCWRLRQTADEWRTAVRDTGDGRGAPPRRTQAERALQDPKASRASAGAVRARPAGRAYRPGPCVRAGGRRRVNRGGTSRTLLGRRGLRSDRAGPPSRRRGAGP